MSPSSSAAATGLPNASSGAVFSATSRIAGEMSSNTGAAFASSSTMAMVCCSPIAAPSSVAAILISSPASSTSSSTAVTIAVTELSPAARASS